MLGMEKIQTPPEFDQEIVLIVPDDYQMFQAPMSTYDIGDLQAFHSQHTLPIVMEDAFRELFGKVKVVSPNEPRLDTDKQNAIFEVRMIDLGHDLYMQPAETYRAKVTFVAAMKSPRDEIFWQQAFHGDGYVVANPEVPDGFGPADAVVDAIHKAVWDMQRAIASSPQVRLQMKHYQKIQEAREQYEIKV